MLGYVGTLSLLLAQASVAQPSPSPTPPKTIVRTKSTPFCTVFRENVFRAVQGLRINDSVIDQGQSILAKWAYDSVVDKGKINGGSRKMDHYQLGLVVGQAAHNLQLVYALLDDPSRFPAGPQDDSGRDLATIKATLQAVADSQERSLNILSGTYETQSLNALLSLGNAAAGTIQQASISNKELELGDPVFTTPGYIPPPTSSSSAHASLFGSTPVGKIRQGVVIAQEITGSVENRVAGAIAPGIARCGRE